MPRPPAHNRYQFEATEAYWRRFYALPAKQKESCRKAWEIFRENPFDKRLRPHKLHGSSAQFGAAVHSVVIEEDLRTLFLVKGNRVISLDLVSHDELK